MQTIINYNDLLSSGLPVSDEVASAKLTDAIRTAETVVVKPRLGDEQYIDILDNPSQYTSIIDGGKVQRTVEKHNPDGTTSTVIEIAFLAGLKYAISHLAFAELLVNSTAVTTFGSVLKKDDYSDQAGVDRLERLANHHTIIGMQALTEVTDWMGIDNTDKWLPNTFEELI